MPQLASKVFADTEIQSCTPCSAESAIVAHTTTTNSSQRLLPVLPWGAAWLRVWLATVPFALASLSLAIGSRVCG